MEAVEDVIDGNAILQQVDPEHRDLFREIFMDEDSDEEFLGFNTDDLENDEGTADFKELHGNMDVHNLRFRGIKNQRGDTRKCRNH